MIGFVRWKMSVGDAFFYVFLIVRHSQKTLTTTADSLNATQCVSQYNYRGFNFGCMDIADSMTWIHTGYYGRTPSASPSDFCERPVVPFADACVPDPSGDRRRMTKDCNTYTNCQTYGKTYSDIVASCPSSSEGFPFAYVSYECLPRKQLDGNYIDTIILWDSSPDSRNLHGKIFFKTFGYPYDLTNKNVRCQVTVDGNTKVSIRLLDAYGRLLNATESCPYSLYLYSSSTNTYYEWCVNRTSWTIDYSIPVVFPAVLQGSGTGSASSSQDIDIVFAKPNANLDAEGALWMLVDAVNVVDNSPGRNVNVSCGPAFMLPVRPTTTATTTTTTPSISTTTSTTTRLPTSTTTTRTTSPAASTMTTTSTTTTPTSTATTTATTTTATTTTTTPSPTSTTTTLTTTSTTTMISKTSRTTPMPSSTASATSSSVTSLPMTSRMKNLTSSGSNYSYVSTPTSNPSPSTTFNFSSTPTENATASNTSGAGELPSPRTNSLNVTQCVSQDNYRGFNFGCMGIADSMTWIHTGYYGRTPSASPSDFCERPDVPSADACVPDPSGDRRRMARDCNTYTNCQTYGKTYSDIVASCSSSSGGFPFAYVSYECLPRKQLDGDYIDMITLWDSSRVYRNLYGKIYLKTYGYPYALTNQNVGCQVTVDGNTKVSIRLLDAYGHLLNATGPCPYSLYLYSSSTNTYHEMCVTETSWTIDNGVPIVFPAVLQGSGTGSTSRSQEIDIEFAKPNVNLDAEGGLWMLVEAVNVVDNSTGRNITVSCGSSFTPQVRPTTTTRTSTTTTTNTKAILATTTSTTTRTPSPTSSATSPSVTSRMQELKKSDATEQHVSLCIFNLCIISLLSLYR